MKTLKTIILLFLSFFYSSAQQKSTLTVPEDRSISPKDSIDHLVVKGSKLIWVDPVTGVQKKIAIEIAFWEGDKGLERQYNEGTHKFKTGRNILLIGAPAGFGLAYWGTNMALNDWGSSSSTQSKVGGAFFVVGSATLITSLILGPILMNSGNKLRKGAISYGLDRNKQKLAFYEVEMSGNSVGFSLNF